MYLKRLTITNFKNIQEAYLEFSSKINCISGNNGEGKTNLLDAIYYLSMTKSFFLSSDAYTFTFGKDLCVINGSYICSDGTEDNVSIGLKRESDKVIKRNGKVYKRIAEHIGLYPIVMVSPADTILVSGVGEERRKYLNIILSQIDKEYLKKAQAYNQLILQRNKLLKMPNFSFELLETIDLQLSINASYIFEKRRELCENLKGRVAEFYSKLSSNKEHINLNYVSDLFNNDLYSLLSGVRERDLFLKHTSVGVHKDDIEFILNGMPLKKCGSQGQQKCFLISLKLAQFEIMQQLHNVAPILLLDDVFDKLDIQRVEYLLSLVSNDNFGQIFISDSNKVRMQSIVERFTDECKTFEVVGGFYR